MDIVEVNLYLCRSWAVTLGQLVLKLENGETKLLPVSEQEEKQFRNLLNEMREALIEAGIGQGLAIE
jgi:hypothetical protein